MARARRRFLIALLAAGLSAGVGAEVGELVAPKWSELSAEQREVLAPLIVVWDDMEDFRRHKWLAIAKRYHALGTEEQARMRLRMQAWANLSPEERRRARERYREIQRLPPEQREALKQKWEAYSTLPPAEREALQAPARDTHAPARRLGGP